MHPIRVLSFLLIVLPVPVLAQTPGTPGSEIVFLVTDCAAAGHTVGTDCFEDVASLQNHIWGTGGLHPQAGSPLVVDIGPGTFAGLLDCPTGGGHVTFRGVGRDRSRLTSAAGQPFIHLMFSADSCDAIGFQDLTLESEPAFGVGYPIWWTGDGSSSWTDVDIIAKTTGWYDVDCASQASDPPSGTHYFYGSKIEAGLIGYYAECGQTWLYGSEIFVRARDQDFPALGVVGIHAAYRGDVRLFGSAVRVGTAGLSSAPAAVAGVVVGANGFHGGAKGFGEFHMHGGIVNVNAASFAVEAVALDVNATPSGGGAPTGDAFAHTLETAFVVNGGGGSTRVTGDGEIQSPLLWQSGDQPPVADLGSITGKDLYVETDCDATGCDGGSDPHLMIYKADCPNSPWFDVVRARCRD